MKRREFLEWLGGLIVGTVSIGLLNELLKSRITEAERFKAKVRVVGLTQGLKDGRVTMEIYKNVEFEESVYCYLRKVIGDYAGIAREIKTSLKLGESKEFEFEIPSERLKEKEDYLTIFYVYDVAKKEDVCSPKPLNVRTLAYRSYRIRKRSNGKEIQFNVELWV